MGEEVQKLTEGQSKLTNQVKAITEGQAKLTNQVKAITEGQERMEKQLEGLKKLMEDVIAKLTETVAAERLSLPAHGKRSVDERASVSQAKRVVTDSKRKKK